MQWPAVNMVGRGGSSGGERSLAGRRAQQLDDQIEHWVGFLDRVNLVLIPHCTFHHIPGPRGRTLRDPCLHLQIFSSRFETYLGRCLWNALEDLLSPGNSTFHLSPPWQLFRFLVCLVVVLTISKDYPLIYRTDME